MSVRLVVVVVGCALASNAMALPFQAFQISAGGTPGIPGLPVPVTNGIINQDPLGGDDPPASTAIGVQPSLEFDSYVGLDSIGPSTAMHTSAAATITSPPYAIPETLSGQWGNPAGVPSSLTSLFGLNESVFVSRLVVSVEAEIDGPQLVADILDEDGFQTVMSDLTIVGGFLRPDDRGGGAEYRFFGLKSLSPFAAQALGGGGSFDVYDIYLVRVIPAPGAALLSVGFICFGSLRRRR